MRAILCLLPVFFGHCFGGTSGRLPNNATSARMGFRQGQRFTSVSRIQFISTWINRLECVESRHAFSEPNEPRPTTQRLRQTPKAARKRITIQRSNTFRSLKSILFCTARRRQDFLAGLAMRFPQCLAEVKAKRWKPAVDRRRSGLCSATESCFACVLRASQKRP